MSGEAVCIYTRVSTTMQAQNDLSLPDQVKSIRAFADEKGWDIVADFTDPGFSARSDNRPAFQAMMARALAKPPEFKRIIVHSMSRLFRDEMYYEQYRRKLEKNGVQIVSITQDFGEGPGADFTRRIMALTDEINSIENAKHVQRAMLENARQNFWNGSAAPLGYRSVVAEVRGIKQKKKLEVDVEGAEIVRLIFQLYLEGDGISGPLGIKNTVKHLNAHGFLTPKNNKFHISYVEKILKDERYIGRAYYNVRDCRLKIDRPREDWIMFSIPRIISDEDFQRVQTQLTLRNPKITAPRRVNSNVLLTGLAICGGCGTEMLRESGKGGKYHYYRCSRLKRTGACDGGSPQAINATLLDGIVLDKVCDQILTPDRVQLVVNQVAAKRAAGTEEAAISLRQLRESRLKTTKKLTNLISMLAEGIVEATDSFKGLIKTTEGDAERIGNLIAVQERIVRATSTAITLEQATAFAIAFRQKLTTSAPALQKRIIRSFVKHIVITNDEIAIIGADTDLHEVVTGSLN